ncbi:hypothetical protein SKAU_G00365030 [Synaphobranchus kaupii]|uniref:Uncharacterized protein n=1 Tax=Synaphobranchus kaupii TaxID=118154 RepID=A0A9Q1EEX7_SYNKA|nr:hypothetical protein SKAU_G00365030 [Synaphobranchus kaupii]
MFYVLEFTALRSTRASGPPAHHHPLPTNPCSSMHRRPAGLAFRRCLHFKLAAPRPAYRPQYPSVRLKSVLLGQSDLTPGFGLRFEPQGIGD